MPPRCAFTRKNARSREGCEECHSARHRRTSFRNRHRGRGTASKKLEINWQPTRSCAARRCTKKAFSREGGRRGPRTLGSTTGRRHFSIFPIFKWIFALGWNDRSSGSPCPKSRSVFAVFPVFKPTFSRAAAPWGACGAIPVPFGRANKILVFYWSDSSAAHL